MAEISYIRNPAVLSFSSLSLPITAGFISFLLDDALDAFRLFARDPRCGKQRRRLYHPSAHDHGPLSLMLLRRDAAMLQGGPGSNRPRVSILRWGRTIRIQEIWPR